MMRLIDIFIRVITIFALAGLLGSYTAPFVNPNTFSLSSLLGLAYHYLLLINSLLLVYWVIRWKKIALASLIVLLGGYPFMRTYYGMNPQNQVEDKNYDLEVLSYNVRQLDIYGWSGETGGSERMIEYINHFPGDIVCLQEFPRQERNLKNFSGFPHSYIGWDLAILSRLEIINEGLVPFESDPGGSAIFCDVISQKDTLRIYCTHLESYRFGDKDRQIFLEFPEVKRGSLSGGIRSIISHLIAANKIRARQAKTLKKHMNESPYPVILCGDFNDTPLSYTYSVLEKGMTDSFIEKGRGVGNTYIGEFPSFRIDHILHDYSMQTIAYSRDTLSLSDHYPIKSRISFTGPSK